MPLRLLGLITTNQHTNKDQLISGPVIIVANHRHPIDPLIFMVGLFPRLTYALLPITPYAAPPQRLNRPGQRIARAFGLLHFVYFLCNATTIPEQGTTTEKLQPLVRTIKQGQSVLIFPEGRCHQGTKSLPFKKGVTELHRMTNIPILPCAITYQKIWGIPRARLTTGTPTMIPQETYVDKGSLAAAEYVRQLVERLYSSQP